MSPDNSFQAHNNQELSYLPIEAEADSKWTVAEVLQASIKIPRSAIVPVIAGSTLYGLAGSSSELFAPEDKIWGIAVGTLVAYIFSIGTLRVLLSALRGEATSVGQLFQKMGRIPTTVLSLILTWLAIVLGLVPLLIPGIIIAARLTFAPVIIADTNLTAVQALRRSFELTQGRVLLIMLLSLIALGATFFVCVILALLGMNEFSMTVAGCIVFGRLWLSMIAESYRRCALEQPLV